jgi:hypothetical protein
MFVVEGEVDEAWDTAYVEWLDQLTLCVLLYPPRGLCNAAACISERICVPGTAISRWRNSGFQTVGGDVKIWFVNRLEFYVISMEIRTCDNLTQN